MSRSKKLELEQEKELPVKDAFTWNQLEYLKPLEQHAQMNKTTVDNVLKARLSFLERRNQVLSDNAVREFKGKLEPQAEQSIRLNAMIYSEEIEKIKKILG